MASLPAPPRHGFEDVVSTETDCTLLSKVLTALSPRHLRERAALEPLWRLSLGQSVPMFRRVRVVGDRTTLNEWAPLPNNRYPSFITPMEYSPNDEEEDDEPMLGVENGDLLLLLPGAYESTRLWDDTGFRGNNVVIGLAGASPDQFVTIYTDDGQREEIPMVECRGKTVFARLKFEPRVDFLGVPLIEIAGRARLHLCVIEPQRSHSGGYRTFENGGIETADELVHVHHGAGFVAYGVTMGPSTSSCIQCNGQCALLLVSSVFRESGRGDKFQHISKANGTFPNVLQGVRPAIAVSFAAVIQMKDCEFRGNYGYPVQYLDKGECEGIHLRGFLLEKSAEQHAREAIKRDEAIFEMCPGIVEFDLSTEDGKEALFRRKLAWYRGQLAEVPLRRTKGFLEMTDCIFSQNARSPHLPDVPDDHQFTAVEPWFGADSNIVQLVDEEDGWAAKEPCYQHEEALQDRKAYFIIGHFPLDELPPSQKELRSFIEDEAIIRALSSSFGKIYSQLDPEKCFRKQREDTRSEPGLQLDLSLGIEYIDINRLVGDIQRMTQNDTIDRTAYGLMDDAAENALRATLSREREESRGVVCQEANKLVVPDNEELAKMCWGILAKTAASFEQAIAAHAVLVLLYGNSSSSISSYRAEVLVERLYCDERENLVEGCPEGCECKTRVPVAQVSAFLLGLHHPNIVCALTNLLEDKTASNHGRSNAGRVLMFLAFAKPERFREQVVAAISGVLSEESDLSKSGHESLVNFLATLRAKEANKAVREAFKRGQRKEHLNDGYIAFLQLVGLPIDLDDEVVSYEIENVELVLSRDTNMMEPRVQGMYAKAVARMTNEVKEHNLAVLGWAPCDHCGKLPPKEDPFSVCSGCRIVAYCDTKCQRAAWQQHRDLCKGRQGN